jgi:hypothetical protein
MYLQAIYDLDNCNDKKWDDQNIGFLVPIFIA